MAALRCLLLSTLIVSGSALSAIAQTVPDRAGSPLVSLDLKLSGPQARSGFGTAVAGAKDITRDGISDVLVGAPFAGSSEQGTVYLYAGGNHTIGPSPVWSATADQPGAHFGWSIAAGADLDGNPYPDVVIGAPGYDGPAGIDAGRVYIYLGTANGLPPNPNKIIDGPQAGAQFGSAVAIAGRVNGDALDDVLVGAPLFSNGEIGEGRAYLYLGSSGGVQNTPAWSAESNQAGAHLGAAVAGIGDINGDGLADIAVGAPNYKSFVADAGRAYVYLGASPAPSTVPVAKLAITALATQFGAAIAGAGDFNGDGYDDFVVGAPHAAVRAGSVRLYLGTASGVPGGPYVYAGPFPSALGTSVAGVGDLNLDGYDDFVAGAPLYMVLGMPMGRLFVFYGTPALPEGRTLDAPTEIDGSSVGMNFGVGVAAGYDANSSCVSDVLVGTTTDGVAFIDGDVPCASACAAPPAPALLSPLDGATGEPTMTTLDWAPATGATSYRLALRCASGSVPLGHRYEIVTGVSFTCTLQPATYTWYVQAFNACNRLGPRSATRTFTVGSGSTCRPVALQTPSDESTCAPITGTLTWQPLPSASGYVVELGKQCEKPDIVATVTGPFYEYVGLDRGRQYYWRVREDCACAAFSECATFQTEDRPPPKPKLTATGTKDVPVSGTLHWRPVKSAVGYRVQLGTSCGTGPESDVPDPSMPYGPLDPGTTYYWRAAARDTCGSLSVYSDCGSFKTESETNAQRVFVAQADPLARGTKSGVMEIDADNPTELVHFDFKVQVDPSVVTVVGWTLDGTRAAGAARPQVTIRPDGRVDVNIDYANHATCPPSIPPGVGSILKLFVDIAPDAPMGPSSVQFLTGGHLEDCSVSHPLPISSDSLSIGELAIASVTTAVPSAGIYGFFDTGANSNLALNFTTSSGEGQVIVERLAGLPNNTTFLDGAHVDTTATHWVIEQDGLAPFEARVDICLFGLMDGPVEGPNSAIYRRSVPGLGSFEHLDTSYDPVRNTLSATVTGFSEFVVATSHVTGVDNQPSNAAPMLRAIGNPVSGELVFEVTMRSAERARLELFDVLGRQRGNLDLSKLGLGTHRVSLAEARSLPPGLYFAKLTQVGYHDVTKVVIVR